MDLVHDVAFSPTTANTLAAVTAKGVVLLWDVNNGQVSKRLATNIVGYHSLAFQPDGLFIVAGGQTEQYKGQIVVLNLSKGSISQTLNTESAVYDMAFSPDGTLLAAGTVDGKILLYQPGSWTLAGTLTSNGAITALAFSPDGTILATISQQVKGGSKTLQLWDVRRAVPLFTKGDIQGMASIAFSPDGHAIASSYFEGNQAIQFWGIPPIR